VIVKFCRKRPHRLDSGRHFVNNLVASVDFRWNEWNLEHATDHGCAVSEIQSVVRNAGRGYPRNIGRGKFLVVGRGIGQRPHDQTAEKPAVGT